MKHSAFRKWLPSGQTIFFLVLIAACALVFTLLTPAFISPMNLYSMLLNASMPAVLALSMGIVISAGGLDLCIGHTAGFVALICGFFLRTMDMNVYLSMIAAVLLAVLIGVVNGFLVSHMGISSFIVTLGMQFVLVGSRQWITSGDSYRANKVIKSIAQGDVLGISNLILISFVIILLVGYLMQKTTFGRKMQFVGSNIVASKYNGIPVKAYTWMAFILSGTIAGLVGILQFSRLTSATINIGDGWLFNAMTIAVFSGVIFDRFKVHGIVLVSILITMITTGINMLGVSNALSNFVLGAILLLALLGGKYLRFQPKNNTVKA